MRNIFYLVLIGILLLSGYSFAQQTYLHCGNLIDVETAKVLKEMTIIVDGNKIQKIEKGYSAVPEGAILVDLKNKTVMPGLIDMHVHIESETSKDGYLKRMQFNDADVAFEAARNAKVTLMAGFTTVRDLGGTNVNISLRNAINKGLVDGPRIYTVGKSIATTGGHGDPSNSLKKEWMGDPGPREGVISGPDEARRAVRQRYKDGADAIKITATGGVLSVAKDGQGPQFTMEELQAIVETSKDYGFLTAAHAHGDEGMQRAVIAGINTIEHGTKMSEKTMDLMIKHGTYYVPTISAGKFVARYAEVDGYYHPLVVPKAREIGPQIQSTFGKAYKKGVKIAFGTDAGVFPHGENGWEFVYMKEAGMPVMEALVSATIVPARLLKADDIIGSIKEGKLADIVATDANPLDVVETLTKVSFVMKDGKIYKQ
jgi:imidazolonepropionase-like amidohydrolase